MRLGDKTPQMTRQLELPFEDRGEASNIERSVEASTATEGNARPGASELMALVVERQNLKLALKRVKQNKGSAGIDGMSVDELPQYLRENWLRVREQLLAGMYQPQPVRRASIPKPGGGERELGIPTVLDRFIQQAVLQVLQPRFDPTFSEHSHGFRPGRSAHGAVREAQRYLQQGRAWVVDVDLSKFFDRVNHDILMGRLARRIADKQLLGLIRRYLNAGILADGVVMERHEGTPQGGPLSPLLANVLLDEVDKELEKRGHAFVRYADDCNVYVRSKRAGERVMAALKKQYDRLRLRINEDKSAVARASKRTFLGFRFSSSRTGVVRPAVAKPSIEKMKARVRVMTRRVAGRSLLRVCADLSVYLRGWKNYFRLGENQHLFERLDRWIRHRLRALQLKQWRTGPTVYRELRKRGLPPDLAASTAGNHRRWWHSSQLDGLHAALPNTLFDKLGLIQLAA